MLSITGGSYLIRKMPLDVLDYMWTLTVRVDYVNSLLINSNAIIYLQSIINGHIFYPPLLLILSNAILTFSMSIMTNIYLPLLGENPTSIFMPTTLYSGG